MPKYLIYSICLSALCLLWGCGSRGSVDAVLDAAGDNRAEIEQVIARYEDTDTAEAARWLVGAMLGRNGRVGAGMDSLETIYAQLPNGATWQLDSAQLARGRNFANLPLEKVSDAAAIPADYLISNLRDAYRLRDSRKWNAQLSDEQFCELLLPYRIGDEPLSDWRRAYRRWLAPVEDSIALIDNAVDAARIVSRFIGSCPYNDQLSTPHRSAIALLEHPVGYCREDCDRTVYAMRAAGIPVAVDMMLVSPENGGGHQWNVVYDNEAGIMRMFDNLRYPPTRDRIHNDWRRKGKVYRFVSEPQTGRLDIRKSAPHAPAGLTNPWLRDVTAEYFGHNEAEIKVDAPSGEVYLGLFTPSGYKPIDIARVSGGKAMFKNIEPELIYFPIEWRSGGFTPCGMPFLLSTDGGIRIFEADTSVVSCARLTRKYPLRFMNRERLASVVGLHVQSSSSAAGPWRDIHVIERPATGNYHRIPLEQPVGDRYIRLFKEGATGANISELIASDDSLALHTRPLEIAGNAEARLRYRTLADGNIMTGTLLAAGAEDLVFRVGGAEPVTNLFVVPGNDDNFVVPGQDYELFYYTAEGWKSLGRKVSQGFDVEFEVPENAVLLLRNHTKGVEEQVFVMGGGRQLFSTDLQNTGCRQ